MTDAVRALLAETPALERASDLSPTRLPVLRAFEEILPFGGLRPGATVGITGIGATSLGLALVAHPSKELWTAAVGLSALGLRAAAELGVSLDRLIVIPDPGTQSTSVLAALVDSFDVVVAPPPHARDARRITGRVRERDAVLVVMGRSAECDLTLQGTAATWHGIGRGYGHLRTRTLDVTITGRGAASRPRCATLWLPDADGNVSIARDTVVPIRHGAAKRSRELG